MAQRAKYFVSYYFSSENRKGYGDCGMESNLISSYKDIKDMRKAVEQDLKDDSKDGCDYKVSILSYQKLSYV